MNEKRSAEPDGFSKMGIPLAGGTDHDGSADPSGDDPPDATPGLDPLDIDVVVGDVTDGLHPIDHAVYEVANGVGFSLLIENTGTRTFERVEARIRLDGGDTRGEFTASGGTGPDRLGPGERWRFWIPIGDGTADLSDTTSRYTIDLRAA
ncbi:hypothetical protein ACFQE8_14085 [Salinirubellus sp. GCM10025818]|uniref:hypothetical protein n=1 Tax=Salinirubellus TaxID=2162630 RepID=UPI0030D2DDE5